VSPIIRHVKGLSGSCLSKNLEIGDTVSHVAIFDPALWTVAPLTFSLVQLSPTPPLPCVNRYTVNTSGYRVLGLRQINTCGKVPLQVNFFRRPHFAMPSMSLVFLRCLPSSILSFTRILWDKHGRWYRYNPSRTILFKERTAMHATACTIRISYV
jgi:hypothetical protein